LGPNVPDQYFARVQANPGLKDGPVRSPPLSFHVGKLLHHLQGSLAGHFGMLFHRGRSIKKRYNPVPNELIQRPPKSLHHDIGDQLEIVA
jgi:hypothetical protein